MEYCTRDELKTYLWISWTSEDVSLSNLITALTWLLDLELGWNLEEKNYSRRISWMGTPRLIMEGPINAISWNEVKLYYSYASNEFTTIKVAFIEGPVVHLERCIPKGVKNVAIEYTRGYSEIPWDMKSFFLKYCKEMRGIDKNWDNNISSKKVEGLQVSYFSPSEIIAAKKENPLKDFASILKKYKNFNCISY